mmetsp:Transcript_26791/g.58382  ORF Transcript_26791/g.58382 Transcript_26791/m.58382 type:complete len:309 (+) Transcript_26791:69-995(+)
MGICLSLGRGLHLLEGKLLGVLTLAAHEGVVELVGLGDHLHSVLLVHALIVEAVLVGGLAVGDLVVTEPGADGIDGAGELLLDIGNVVAGSGLLVAGVDGDDLPVKLTIVDHGKDAQGLHLDDRAHGVGLGANLHNVNGVVVTEHALNLVVLVGGVLPGQGEHAVVPVDVVGVVTELALLHVLLDGGALLVGGNLHLGLGLLGDLDDGVKGAIVVVQGDIVPRGDGLLALGEEDAVLGGRERALLLLAVRGGGHGAGGEGGAADRLGLHASGGEGRTLRVDGGCAGKDSGAGSGSEGSHCYRIGDLGV